MTPPDEYFRHGKPGQPYQDKNERYGGKCPARVRREGSRREERQEANGDHDNGDHDMSF